MGNVVELEKVGKFCYLGDMLDAEGGADLAMATRMVCEWKTFWELSPLLASKGISLKLKGKELDKLHTTIAYTIIIISAYFEGKDKQDVSGKKEGKDKENQCNSRV
jgi:hypothetical protein